MVNRKAVVALIDGRIYIDPSDVSNVDIEKIKAEAKKALGRNDIEIVVKPIATWMPAVGTEALMNQALKDLGIHDKKVKPIGNDSVVMQTRNMRRIAKKKHGKRFF